MKLKTPKFKQVAQCEMCGEHPATHFDYFKMPQDGGKHWHFCCNCIESSYFFEIARFFNSPSSTVDWLAHLNDKMWMEDKWLDFMDMMDRFRKATNSYGQT